MVPPLSWQAPVGPCSVLIDGVEASLSALVQPDAKQYVVRVFTLCGTEEVGLEIQPLVSEPASVLARRCQLVSSIHHVLRRACIPCRERMIRSLTALERRYLVSSEPKLGDILGAAGAAILLAEAGGAAGLGKAAL